MGSAAWGHFVLSLINDLTRLRRINVRVGTRQVVELGKLLEEFQAAALHGSLKDRRNSGFENIAPIGSYQLD